MRWLYCQHLVAFVNLELWAKTMADTAVEATVTAIKRCCMTRWHPSECRARCLCVHPLSVCRLAGLPASPCSSLSFARQCVAGLLGVVTVAGPLPMNFNINRFRDPDDFVSLELLKTITVSLVAWFKCSHFSHIPDLARNFCTGTENGRRQLSTS